MTTLPPPSSRGKSECGYLVRRPQAGDVLGSALRNAYAESVGLPDDMQRIVSKLNRTEVSAH